ncbi:hypothetical protein, partial [Pseudomonas lactis]|uniref:hypothetical protein n=3 Tax=Bacteria TaxID=2 RepID=UPI0021663EAB
GGGAVTPPLYRRLFRFSVFGLGVEAQTSPVMFLVVMRKFAITTEELGVKISIELDRKDVLALIAVLLLMLPDSGALRGFEAGESLLYLIHRNKVYAGAILDPIKKGAEYGA